MEYEAIFRSNGTGENSSADDHVSYVWAYKNTIATILKFHEALFWTVLVHRWKFQEKTFHVQTYEPRHEISNNVVCTTS